MQGCFFPFPYGSRFSLASPLARVLGHHPSSLLCFPAPTPVSVRLPPHCQGGSYPVPKPIWELFQVQAAQVRTHSMAVADLGCRDGLGRYGHIGPCNPKHPYLWSLQQPGVSAQGRVWNETIFKVLSNTNHSVISLQ